MNEERWGEIVDLIEQKFGIIERTKEEIPIGDDFEDGKAREQIEIVIFNGPLGKMEIQRITRPVILEKKAHYTKRVGQGAQVEITYSEDDFFHKIKAFKWDESADEWVEIEAGKLDFQ